MTSAGAAETADGTPRATPARRRAAVAPLRRLSGRVLIVGTVLAGLAAFGPLWMVRCGLLIAVAAAVLACLTAWREVAEARRSHAQDMRKASRAHGAALTEERRHNASLVEALTVRAVRSAAEVARLRGDLSSLTSTVKTLQSQHRADVAVLAQREKQIDALQRSLRSRERELAALPETSGQVRSLPRRAQLATDQQPEADELTTNDRHPEATDLVPVSVALPNYEGERQLA